MLKILFSVAGVLFIGLGLFGGNVLEGFSGNQSDSTMTTLVPGQTTGQTIGLTADQANAEQETPAAVVTTASVAVTDTAGSAVVATDKAEQAVAQIADAATSEQPVESAAEILVVDNSGGDGAEPMAPAQQAGDLITMAEQVKSSSRNEQVNMAKAVLTSSLPQPAVEGVRVEIAEQALADKSQEVEIAIKTTVGDIGTDPLIVIKDRVNLREGPSIDHPIVLTLEHGQELMEFKREGKWIHVGAYGTSGKIGWVHQRLVGPIAR